MNITPFNFNSHEVRVINKDGDVWFVANDIAKTLGYAEAKDLTRVLDDDEKGRHNVPTPSGNQEMTLINESGLYHAVLKSRKPEAKPFRKWVTSEVLPTIRKTGSYGKPDNSQPEVQKVIEKDIKLLIREMYSKKECEEDAKPWIAFYKQFDVEYVDDLPAHRLSEAIEWVRTLPCPHLPGSLMLSDGKKRVDLPEGIWSIKVDEKGVISETINIVGMMPIDRGAYSDITRNVFYTRKILNVLNQQLGQIAHGTMDQHAEDDLKTPIWDKVKGVFWDKAWR